MTYARVIGTWSAVIGSAVLLVAWQRSAHERPTYTYMNGFGII